MTSIFIDMPKWSNGEFVSVFWDMSASFEEDAFIDFGLLDFWLFAEAPRVLVAGGSLFPDKAANI